MNAKFRKRSKKSCHVNQNLFKSIQLKLESEQFMEEQKDIFQQIYLLLDSFLFSWVQTFLSYLNKLLINQIILVCGLGRPCVHVCSEFCPADGSTCTHSHLQRSSGRSDELASPECAWVMSLLTHGDAAISYYTKYDGMIHNQPLLLLLLLS